MGELQGMGIDVTGWDFGGYSGDADMGGAVGVPSQLGAILPGDMGDYQHMGGFNTGPAKSEAAPWWANAAIYGFSRAIDNAFPGSPTGTMGNTYPGSGAGYGGRTYTNRPTGAGGNTVSAKVRSPIGNMDLNSNPVLLLALLGIAYVIIK